MLRRVAVLKERVAASTAELVAALERERKASQFKINFVPID